MWKDLIVNICAICDMCEDSHLNARGESFYGQHKMFEDISANYALSSIPSPWVCLSHLDTLHCQLSQGRMPPTEH